jgi:acetyl-CoA acyltransferase
MMKERIAVIEGLRSPFCKAGGVLREMEADDLGAYIVRELVLRADLSPEDIDELIFGNVLQPIQSTNIARILAVKAGLPVKLPAFTVNRNCASGMEAIVAGANKIRLGDAQTVIAGGTESMSNFPVLLSRKMKELLTQFNKAKSWNEKLKTLLNLRPSHLIPEFPAIADPLCGLTMGQTAEILAREFKISRQEQDEFALMSQERAAKATQEGRFSEEIVPIPVPPSYAKVQGEDEGPRANQTLEALSKLKPSFDPLTGTVTAGNSSPLTDGAAAVLLMHEAKAKERGLKPLGYIRESSTAALDPSRMGLGPVYAMAKLLDKTGLTLQDFDLIEINEAFAAQVLAVLKACASPDFAKRELGRETALGEINLDKLNVNGGAIALGHPLGSSGARLVLTLLKEMRRRGKKRGMATLCVGGGQGGAILLEGEDNS